MGEAKSDIRVARVADIQRVAVAAGSSVDVVRQVLRGYYPYEGPTKRRILKVAAEAGLAPAPEPAKALRERPCLCCGATILSEGPHHRLCQVCRRRDPGDAPVRPAIPAAYHRHPR